MAERFKTIRERDILYEALDNMETKQDIFLGFYHRGEHPKSKGLKFK